jgi:uncharacterized protein (DUF1501 family)
MFSRRDFLRTSLQTSTLVALAPTVPRFLEQAARAAQPNRDGRVLVVIQLDGGNDGINTVVPFADPGYTKYRKVLRLPTDRLFKVNKEVGLHPALRDAAKLLEKGQLAIVQGVGYPNPSRSHFKSMAIWHTAEVHLPVGYGDKGREDEQTRASLGWLGQALDGGQRPRDGAADAVFVGTGSLPTALRGRRAVASTVTRLEDAVLTLKGNAQAVVAGAEPSRDLATFVQRSTLEAYASSDRMRDVLRTKDRDARYPASGLAGQLRLIARLLKGGVGTRIFYAAQQANAYDTHYLQLPAHSNVLDELSGALGAFLSDLATAKLAERVAVLCFSEFGRRVQENGSEGTDHGTAGPVFVAGPSVRVGLVGEAPKLLDLEDGDLKTHIDFRQVYATILEDWLGLPTKAALGREFRRLPLFRS